MPARPSPHDYALRVQRLADLCDREWTARGPADIAFVLEGLGVAPDDFERILRHAMAIAGSDLPAALTDASAGYRIGAVPLEDVTRLSGRPIGVYLRWAVLVWPKTEQQFGLG